MNVLEQICTVRAINDNGSSFILSLEPKKEKCKGCNGKCAKMLKPTELIEVEYEYNDLAENDLVLLYMAKKDLTKMVFNVLGYPLILLVLFAFIANVLSLNEYFTIAAIFTGLILMFILQVKFIKLKKQIKVKKIIPGINVE